ncbi:GNAT family N-acetyltransferase [Bacillus sp. 1P06AnD]|uniref:GNAT family N-acetyltransferase n=1 Tax=Bacillus sp. 1P06AnD TaxID=3132208 RepID=UPI0039A10543
MMIRKAQAGDEKAIAAVHVQSWKETYRGLIKDEILEKLDVKERERNWKITIENNQIVYAACDDHGQIVGFASGGKNRHKPFPHEGELYAIYLLAEHQGKGLGKNLFLRTMEAIKNSGCQSILVWVLSENPTRFFYESFGCVKLGEAYIDRLEVEEIAYGYSDLTFLGDNRP